jgi:transcriptional regulator NrdR family protein
MSDAKPKDSLGLICRKCGCTDLRVKHTRRFRDKIIRERECRYCGKRMRSTETLPGNLTKGE